MRRVTDHEIDGHECGLEVVVCDQPGSGGANHHYQIVNVSRQNTAPDSADFVECEIEFQNGPIKEVGVNGVTHEVLLAIVADRLKAFQSGPFANSHNEIALKHVELALSSLKTRTIDRINRGVEGQLKQ